MQKLLSSNAEGLGPALVLDELFDLTLYKKLREFAANDTKKMMDELITVETKHVEFWQDFFNIHPKALDWQRKFKLLVLVFVCRAFGDTAIHLVLEAIEIYGIHKYLSVWELYKDKPLGSAVREILWDEFEHEDQVVSGYKAKKINPEKIRHIFLGFNDGLVEILGAISGFFAAFGESLLVIAAGFIVACAGALSMAAGVFVASGSEAEIKEIEARKRRFLEKPLEQNEITERPLSGAFYVGISYFIGAMIPVFPVLLGAKSLWVSLIFGGGFALLVSFVLAFLSGMDKTKRLLTNGILIAIAVGITYALSTAVKIALGVDL